MLSIQKLNNEKKRVNQHLTELGIKKDNQKEIIEAVALTLQPKEFQNEEASVDKQLLAMKREKDEKKLLEYQLKTSPQNVSTFLANKYSDGNFNRALTDHYDNTEERIKHGLTFEYHVYLPKDSKYDSQRGPNRYHLSETITDRKVGDKYVYHVPIYIDSSQDTPFFVTDYGEIINDPNSHGLLKALSHLRVAIDSGRFYVDPEAEVELATWGFLVDGKIVHDIKGGVMVEKYLNTIMPEKRVEAIKYLDSSLKKTKLDDGDNDITEITEEIIPSSLSTTESTTESSTESLPDEPTITFETPDGELVPAPPPVKFTQYKTIPIKKPDYSKMNLEQIAKSNDIPVIEYEQVRTRSDMSTRTKSVVFILVDRKLYKIGLRTGVRQVKIGDFEHDQKTYNDNVMAHVAKDVLVLRPVPQTVKTLLSEKGFKALFSNEEPPITVHGFTAARTM